MRARIFKPELENITTVAEALQRGEVAGVPTETVYGLAGDCHNPLAVTRIFQAKERPTFDPLIVHVPASARSLGALERLKVINAQKIPDSAKAQIELLMSHFWPGPLTLIFPKHDEIPDLVTSGLPTVAVRMPRHPVMQSLLATCGVPLAAPSANRFGHISPTTAQAVMDELGDRIDLILDGGTCEVGLESTILFLPLEGSHTPTLLRHGGISQEEIEKVLGTSIGGPALIGAALGPSEEAAPDVSAAPSVVQGLQAPGMLAKHYAPTKPFYLLPNTWELSRTSESAEFIQEICKKSTPSADAPAGAVGLLLLSGDPVAAQERLSALLQRPVIARSLSPKGDLAEAAHSLFAEMRFLDALPEIELIFSEPCVRKEGLGHAIADRLWRASQRY